MKRTGERLAGYLMTAPFYVLFGVFGLFPLLYTAWVALHHWHLVNGDTGFAGLGNFAVLLQDPYFYNALFNTVSIFVLSTVPQLLAALGLAALLDRPLRARTLWRASVLLPNVVSVVAVALVFSQLFAEDYGVVNWALGLAGIDPVDWRSDRFASHVAVSTMVMWRWTGYNALLYLAAMQSVPQERYDAAMLDGASRWRTFWSITVPAIRPTIAFTVVVSTIGGLQLFAEPQLFDDTGVNGTGGADRQFQTLAMYLYEKGFGEFDAGYAAAIAWLLFLCSAVFALVNFSLVRRMRGGE
ncbi:carbohydrate ABC transporter permease [Amycolatopsis lurida]|uniref:ABC transporter permease n=1 Tax=Amycolatopsis lurida NRRL 2430 TaxID=1460371 RepID=A0A2P2FEX4_AMYLU|nr:sugar ABC transporter permease [Amycolatopsis lurida]KFU75265.1 ABC transporter permease [Amycolatopsis lurida NRRL 2430]